MASTSTPRSLATRRWVVRCCNASIVARTMLCGLVEPRLFVRISRTPAHSSTARTGPPAITPVPVAAGLRRTRPAPWSPTISCGIVPPVSGTSIARRRMMEVPLTGGTIPHEIVGDRAACERHFHHAPARGFHGFAHRLAHFVGLAGRDADPSLSIADGDQRVEPEAPAPLDDLGDAVDRDHVLDETVAFALALTAVAALTAAPPAPPATATASAASPTPASSPPTPARGPLLHRRRL